MPGAFFLCARRFCSRPARGRGTATDKGDGSLSAFPVKYAADENDFKGLSQNKDIYYFETGQVKAAGGGAFTARARLLGFLH